MLRPNPAIEKLAPSIHGGVDIGEVRKLGLSPEAILDFSVSCNPFGPPPGVAEALKSASIECYPDSEARELTESIAERLEISLRNLIIGSGSTELIRLIALAYFSPEDVVLIPQPTYSEYEIASQLAGAQVIKQMTTTQTGFKLDVSETVRLIRECQPIGIFLCNPNNPTGRYLARGEVTRIVDAAQESLVVIDEAYIAFTDAWASLDLVSQGNVVVVRSMTKDYALAGLRLGYAVAAESIISVLKRIRPPWNVNTPAQKAGIAALKADGYLQECGTKIDEARSYLLRELPLLGLPPLPSQTNFFLVRVSHASQFRQALLKKGFLVRDCTSFGLPDCVRLAPRTLPECQKLIAAIRDTGAR